MKELRYYDSCLMAVYVLDLIFREQLGVCCYTEML